MSRKLPLRGEIERIISLNTPTAHVRKGKKKVVSKRRRPGTQGNRPPPEK